MEYSNIYYFKKICAIGGTEQFLYEIAKKYNDYDITIFYDEIDMFQYLRLSKLVRCVKRKKGEKVICKKAFFNFNIDMIDDVESTENYYAFVSHANFEELGYKPPINHPKLNHFIAVSEFARERLITYAKRYFNKDIEVETCYNPLMLEPKERVIKIVSAGRIDDKVKGGERTKIIIKALDDYCKKNGCHYIWHIFTNPIKNDITSKNVAIMKPRIDVRPYIADADIFIQVSNDMETFCYSLNEAWSYGVHTISTPLSVLKELNVPEEANYILDWNCENIDDVVKHIFEDKLEPFKYKAPEDAWLNIIDKTKSNYEEERKMKCRIRCTSNFYDVEAKKDRVKDDEWVVDRERADYLVVERQLCELVNVFKEVKKEDKKIHTNKVEKEIK